MLRGRALLRCLSQGWDRNGTLNSQSKSTGLSLAGWESRGCGEDMSHALVSCRGLAFLPATSPCWGEAERGRGEGSRAPGMATASEQRDRGWFC